MGKKRVLIVDDDAEVRGMFEQFLTRKGYETIAAPNALEALRICKKQTPDLVLTDYHMPEMNGVELLKELRDMYPKVPVILMSGQADMRTAVDALREQAFDFLSKPIDSNNLLETMQSAFRDAHASLQPEAPASDAGRILGPMYVRGLESNPSISVLTFNRPLDQHSVQTYEASLRRLQEETPSFNQIIVILKGVNYINNLGLNLLLSTFDRWKSEKRRVAFAHLSEPVHKYLRMLGYLQYFPVATSLQDAVALVS